MKFKEPLNSDQQKKALKKFLKENKKEVNALMKSYADLFNKCGKETGSGEVQLAFSGAVMIPMFAIMGNVPLGTKLILIKKMRDFVKKQ